MLDLLIIGGSVVDGTGKQRYKADIGIIGDTIVDIGILNNRPSKETINADGLIISPGFIDSHTHSDLSILRDPSSLPKLSQGVTTEVIGNCGMSAAPVNRTTSDLLKDYVKPVLGEGDFTWEGMGDFLDIINKNKPAVNIAVLIGHGTLRTAVLGFEDRAPTQTEMEQMKQLVRDALEVGALGMSTGLGYPPGSYSTTEELIELSKVIFEYNGVYTTHLRDQVDGLIDSVKEAITIGEKANIPIVISHHKTVGKRNFGKVKVTLQLLDKAYENGLSTSSDMYPYLHGSTTLVAVLPPWTLEGGLGQLLNRLKKDDIREKIKQDLLLGLDGWENRSKAIGWGNIIINHIESGENKRFEHKSVLDAANEVGKEPADFVMDLINMEKGNIAILFNNSTEEDLLTVLRHSRTMIGSDGLDVGENPHPRLYGTFPKLLGEYVREKGILSLEEGIHRMTGLTAKELHIADVGFIKRGYRADITIFNEDTVKDIADFRESRRLSEGIICVIVGGELAYQDKRLTGKRNGKILRRK